VSKWSHRPVIASPHDDTSNPATLIEFKGLHEGQPVTDEREDQLREIEATQQELKQSIETSRQLADKAQDLLDKHRRDLTPKP
jgi:hypothetical protein